MELAIEGETHEYTDMYAGFRNAAVPEGNTDALKEYDEQIVESKEYAAQFKAVLEKAAKVGSHCISQRIERQDTPHEKLPLHRLRFHL